MKEQQSERAKELFPTLKSIENYNFFLGKKENNKPVATYKVYKQYVKLIGIERIVQKCLPVCLMFMWESKGIKQSYDIVPLKFNSMRIRAARYCSCGSASCRDYFAQHT